MSLKPAEMEILRQASAKTPQAREDFPGTRLPGHFEIAPARDMDFHVVAFA